MLPPWGREGMPTPSSHIVPVASKAMLFLFWGDACGHPGGILNGHIPDTNAPGRPDGTMRARSRRNARNPNSQAPSRHIATLDAQALDKPGGLEVPVQIGRRDQEKPPSNSGVSFRILLATRVVESPDEILR